MSHINHGAQTRERNKCKKFQMCQIEQLCCFRICLFCLHAQNLLVNSFEGTLLAVMRQDKICITNKKNIMQILINSLMQYVQISTLAFQVHYYLSDITAKHYVFPKLYCNKQSRIAYFMIVS